MGNFALQTSPCSFLKSRISPWEISFPFLLCSLITGALIFFPTGSNIQTYLCFLPLSLCFPFLSRQRAAAAGLGRAHAAVAAAGELCGWRLQIQAEAHGRWAARASSNGPRQCAARRGRAGAADARRGSGAGAGSAGGGALGWRAQRLGSARGRAERAARLARGAGEGGAGAARAGASWRAQGGAHAASGGAREQVRRRAERSGRGAARHRGWCWWRAQRVRRAARAGGMQDACERSRCETRAEASSPE
jgi:hypothetical protein